MKPTKEMIEAGWKVALGLNKMQVERIVVAALSAASPATAVGIVDEFDTVYPELYWHVAKGKIAAGEPLYGAIIATIGGTEIGHGESDLSAEAAFALAISDAGLPPLQARAIAAEARLAEAVKLMEPFASVTTADGLPDGFLRIPDDHPFLFNATGFPGEETWKPVVTVGHLRAARAFVDREKNMRKVAP